MLGIADNYFINTASELINVWCGSNCKDLSVYQISMVWSGYILGNRKALFIVLVNDRPYAGLYFEVTQSKDNTFCLDIYRKTDQIYKESFLES